MSNNEIKSEYKKWANMPTWKAWEAVMLLMYMKPEGLGYTLYWIVNNRHQFEDNKYDKVLHCYEVISRAIQSGEIPCDSEKFIEPMDAISSPANFVRIAKKYKLHVPKELANIQDSYWIVTKVLNWIWQGFLIVYRHKWLSTGLTLTITILTLLTIDYHLAWQHTIWLSTKIIALFGKY